MKLRAIPLLSLLAVIALVITGSTLRVQAQQSTAVEIEAVTIVGTTLTITGRNFGGSTPTVQVGESSAAVASHTPTQIVAEAPALGPGFYSLTVVRDANPGGTALSTLQVR